MSAWGLESAEVITAGIRVTKGIPELIITADPRSTSGPDIIPGVTATGMVATVVDTTAMVDIMDMVGTTATADTMAGTAGLIPATK